MSDVGDGPFAKGDPVWVEEAGGSQRAAEYIGVQEASAWFGGPPNVFVMYTDDRSAGTVEVDRVIPRETGHRRAK